MWPIIGAVAASIVVLLAELPALRDLRQYREMAMFIFLTAAALALFTLQSLHVQLPNPLEWLSRLFEMTGFVNRR